MTQAQCEGSVWGLLSAGSPQCCPNKPNACWGTEKCECLRRHVTQIFVNAKRVYVCVLSVCCEAVPEFLLFILFFTISFSVFVFFRLIFFNN